METSASLSEITTARDTVSKDTENKHYRPTDVTGVGKSVSHTNGVIHIISSACRTLTMTGQTLDHKTNPDKLK